MEKKKQIRWESYESMLERTEKNAKRRQTRELRRKLHDPATPTEEKDRLMKELYRDIKILYAEPEDYIPKKFRKKYKLGEYAEPEKETKKEEKYVKCCGGIKMPPIQPPIFDEDKKEEK